MTVQDRIHDRTTSSARAAVQSDGLTIEGYITVFNEREEIQDWLGSYTEEIAPGAFEKTLRQRGPAKVRMQFDHGFDFLFGELPIGVWEDLHEDDHGLWGRGRIHDTWHTVPIRAAIESGALSGQSFRFRVLGESWDKSGDVDHRTITEVSLLEAGPVTWPAYEATTVGLRSSVDAGLTLWRAILRGDRTPVTAPVGGTGQPARPPEAGLPVVTTLAERRRRALVLRGVVPYEPTGEAAAAAS
jgi:uncharacterized protein